MVKSRFGYHYLGLYGTIEGPAIGTLLESIDTFIMQGLKGRKVHPVVLNINSAGGCAEAAGALRAALAELKKTHELWTVMQGEVSSAAIDIYMMGHRRFRHGFGQMTIHRAYTESGDRYQTQDHKAALYALQHQDRILEIIINQMRLPVELADRAYSGQDVTIMGSRLDDYGITTHEGTVWDYIRRHYGANKKSAGVKKPSKTSASKRKGA